MRNNETGKDWAVRGVMTDKVHGRTLFANSMKREKGEKPLLHL